ncbi:hypothetical protein TNCV_597151 [Trichonephila clavipes]|nr:hypothetical protein TNCV_597151 [Trichonephila clavipes]
MGTQTPHSGTQREEVYQFIGLFDSLRGRREWHFESNHYWRSKQQSMEWRNASSPVKVKSKQTLSKRKIMATVFWDRRGVLLVYFMPQGTTLNSGAYCAIQRKLRKHCKTNGAACCQTVVCSFTITQGITLLERLGS